MLNSVMNYMHIYISRPTVVVVDVLLLSVCISIIAGMLLLRRRVSDLNVAILQLQNKITKNRQEGVIR
jgi:outer membrane murein-binding lipoprotein Lpp